MRYCGRVGRSIARVGGGGQSIRCPSPVGEGALIVTIDAGDVAQQVDRDPGAAAIPHAVERRGHAAQCQVTVVQEEAHERAERRIMRFIL
jgi:hypothetical protein